MALDVGKYKPKGIRKLPVLLLLDVSGSMSGSKIKELHDAVVEMINSYVKLKERERVIEVAIITFGASVDLYTRYTPVDELQKKGVPQFIADGYTPLGMALKMAKDYLEDPDETPRGNYAPVAVLVSDGAPNDEWRGPLKNFISTGRTQKAQRFAVAIGVDADTKMLSEFAQDGASIYYTNNAKELADAFRDISTRSAEAAGAGSGNAAKPKSGNPQAGGASTSAADSDEDDWMGV